MPMVPRQNCRALKIVLYNFNKLKIDKVDKDKQNCRITNVDAEDSGDNYAFSLDSSSA